MWTPTQLIMPERRHNRIPLCECSIKCNESESCSSSRRSVFCSNSRNNRWWCLWTQQPVLTNYVSLAHQPSVPQQIYNADISMIDLNPGMSNYELLNNVPPNVSLQRSTNVAPESQLSPGFSPNLMQQQLSPNQRAPFSPQSNQGNTVSWWSQCRTLR